MNDRRLSLMLVFFDGEEAFDEWSSTDSIYGARNLALKWSNTPHPNPSSNYNVLQSMDMLVLLDLLGAKSPVFYSYFRDTQKWHSLLSKVEDNLRANSIISTSVNKHFQPKSTFSYVEDDHIPFLQRSVPILHLIPKNFPRVWHTLKDNYNIIDFNTVESLTKVLHGFVISYLSGTVPTTGLQSQLKTDNHCPSFKEWFIRHYNLVVERNFIPLKY